MLCRSCLEQPFSDGVGSECAFNRADHYRFDRSLQGSPGDRGRSRFRSAQFLAHDSHNPVGAEYGSLTARGRHFREHFHVLSKLEHAAQPSQATAYSNSSPCNRLFWRWQKSSGLDEEVARKVSKILMNKFIPPFSERTSSSPELFSTWATLSWQLPACPVSLLLAVLRWDAEPSAYGRPPASFSVFGESRTWSTWSARSPPMARPSRQVHADAA